MSFAPSIDSRSAASVERSDSYASYAASAAAFERAPTPRAVRGEIAIELELRHAGRRALRLRYEIQGDRALPAVFVAGGISAHRHLAPSREFAEAGWWESQVGAGRSLDPARHCLVSFDWVGADGALDAAIDPADQADAVAALLDALKIARLQAFVGYSYGAMVGLQFAARHPQRIESLVSISGTHRAHPYAAAWRALQRRAVALGALQCDEAQGLALARELAVLSYRTPEEFAERFGAAQVVDGRVRVDAEDYLDHCGNKYVARTSPTAFLRLSESIDLQQVDPAAIRIPVTVVAVGEDRLIPLGDNHELVERLRGETRLRVLRSIYGHDACLKEQSQIDTILREALADCTSAAA
ncbi:homoserine O-succinyltransferase MetX [Lysobacter enzymogenes]|uniref:Homoserine O-succinyltransferase n=1 Tax=Lysobacter enzymogenes TaxID=69 RepID=A0A3N2RBB8_LYSEN|nr:homoserine O-succinyltransferase [Lysobacter enzymogenes]ROU04705.1 homoserine O-succinyltransferase [Lysobacter enzymogenes]